MKKTSLPPVFWPSIVLLALLKIALHLTFIENYGFHRDELLYVALGKHPDLGYWSNPPLLGWISAAVQQTLGGDLWAMRLVPAIVMSVVVVLAGLMAREMKGGWYAQSLAAFIAFFSPAFLRTGHMFQPVCIDIGFWTLYCWLLLKYLNTEDKKYILYFGIAFGLGMLNKYMVGFYLIALLTVLLFSRYKNLLWSKSALWAAMAAFLILSPNLVWQYLHDFPVVVHMTELSSTQLVNVTPRDFLADQLLMHAPSLLIWLAGLGYLLLHPKGRPYRILGILYLVVIALFLIMKGKSYYTLGMYPVLMAAGAVYAERLIIPLWGRLIPPVVVLGLLLPLMPVSIPVIPLDKTASYFSWVAEDLGLEGIVRWEDGRLYTLPQDYADMLGWKEIAQLTKTAYQEASEKEKVLIYAENYGQAGAIAHFAPALPDPVSFSDTYLLWAPKTIDAHTLIYVNNELGEDVQNLFADIREIGRVNMPISRQNGDRVYLCQQPKQDLKKFWEERIAIIFADP